MVRAAPLAPMLLAWALMLASVQAADRIADGAAPESAQPLPEPLTLEHALSLADAPHPVLLAATAARDAAAAERDLAAAAYGLNAGLNGAAVWSEPADRAFDQSYNDGRAGVYLRKRLYDFGRTRGQVAAASAQLGGSESQLADTRLQRRLDILENYLNVLLADLRFRVQDEAMAIAYVRLDRANDRHELGQISDVDHLAIDTRYQETRSARLLAQAEQRTARVRLAAALNRPGQLSAELAEPDLRAALEDLPEFDALLAQVLQSNPRLAALRARTEAARARLQAARAAERPILSGLAQANEYQRQTGDSSPWAVGVELEVPLYTGGRGAAERARARAELAGGEAELARAQSELRQTVHALWEEIQVLRAGRDETRTRLDYRELHLDRSRALYEMEFNADLGDAMVESSAARLHQAELDYRLLLSRARLDALRGRELFAAGAGEENAP